MPAGDGQPEQKTWQPVPGVPGAFLYPFIRKIDTISSNSYLLRMPDVIILIDPGGLASQVAHLVSIIRECRKEAGLPLFVFLTHIHADHFIGVQENPAFAFPESAVFSVQEEGVAALAGADRRLTLADLVGLALSPIRVGFPLVTKERSQVCGTPVSLAFANGAEVTVVRDPPDTPGGTGLVSERISFGPGQEIDIYHTPGHSPDSICIRAGELLFIGDILFAANPGIAGVSGWSQEDLVRSLAGVGKILGGGSIREVCPGHGRVLSAADAARLLETVKADAHTLAGIAELDRKRAEETAAYAEDCMEEINEIFTIMAGRLYYLSYIMDELGEPGMARQVHDMLNGDAIDELLEAFRDFSDEHHRKDEVPIHLALKAGQVIAKLDRSFKKDDLARLIDPSLVQRSARLLSDYTTMLRGFCPPCDRAVCDIAGSMSALVTGLLVPACSDDEILAAADDEDAFIRALLARAGARPLLEEIDLAFDPGDRPVTVLMDRDLFLDLATFILEDLVGTGSRRIAITIDSSGACTVVTMAGDQVQDVTTGREGTYRFLSRLAGRAGGELSLSAEGGWRMFVITFSRQLPGLS